MKKKRARGSGGEDRLFAQRLARGLAVARPEESDLGVHLRRRTKQRSEEAIPTTRAEEGGGCCISKIQAVKIGSCGIIRPGFCRDLKNHNGSRNRFIEKRGRAVDRVKFSARDETSAVWGAALLRGEKRKRAWRRTEDRSYPGGKGQGEAFNGGGLSTGPKNGS